MFQNTYDGSLSFMMIIVGGLTFLVIIGVFFILKNKGSPEEFGSFIIYLSTRIELKKALYHPLFILFILFLYFSLLINLGSLVAKTKTSFLVSNTNPPCLAISVNGNNIVCSYFDKVSKEIVPNFHLLSLEGHPEIEFRYDDVGPLHRKPTPTKTPLPTPTSTPTEIPKVIPTNTPTP